MQSSSGFHLGLDMGLDLCFGLCLGFVIEILSLTLCSDMGLVWGFQLLV